MFESEILVSGPKCRDCGGTHGIHTVLCPRFHCKECGHRGADEDHRGGCPKLRQHEVRWECQCGVQGWMSPIDTSLAGMVRQARREHKRNNPCGDPDIEKLERRPEYERRKYEAKIHPGVF